VVFNVAMNLLMSNWLLACFANRWLWDHFLSFK
jgi:hypothetical protein